MTVEIIEHYMEEVAKNHLPNIAKKLQVSLEEVQQACEEIRSLNPKPGSSFSDREQLRYISPDAVVVKLENQFEILINEYQYPGFSISNYYQKIYEKRHNFLSCICNFSNHLYHWTFSICYMRYFFKTIHCIKLHQLFFFMTFNHYHLDYRKRKIKSASTALHLPLLLQSMMRAQWTPF